MNKFVLLTAVIAIALGGCETTKQVEVVATEAERAKPPMPAACRADGHDAFKPVPKAKGKDATESTALGHTLQSNKSRMTKNIGRTIECECALAKESGNPDDLKRLAGRCPAGDAKGHPIAPTKTEPPVKRERPKTPEVT
jgi:hypothetical protein